MVSLVLQIIHLGEVSLLWNSVCGLGPVRLGICMNCNRVIKRVIVTYSFALLKTTYLSCFFVTLLDYLYAFDMQTYSDCLVSLSQSHIPHSLCLRSEGVIIYDTRTCFTVLFHRWSKDHYHCTITSVSCTIQSLHIHLLVVRFISA